MKRHLAGEVYLKKNPERQTTPDFFQKMRQSKLVIQYNLAIIVFFFSGWHGDAVVRLSPHREKVLGSNLEAK